MIVGTIAFISPGINHKISQMIKIHRKKRGTATSADEQQYSDDLPVKAGMDYFINQAIIWMAIIFLTAVMLKKII
jgi:hypothetical protein